MEECCYGMENFRYGMERVKRVWNIEISRSMPYHALISLSHIRLLVYAMTRLIFSGLVYIAIYLTTPGSSESSCNQENPCPLTGTYNAMNRYAVEDDGHIISSTTNDSIFRYRLKYLTDIYITHCA